MFGLFGKKKAQSPEEQLNSCQAKRDWPGLSRAYYDLGVTAMEEGNLEKAVLWLHRADTIYSAMDNVYEKLGEAITDDCSDRIGTLEDSALIYNDFPELVNVKADGLSETQVRIWGLLSLARLVKLCVRLSAAPGCEALGKLGWAVDVVFKTFQEPPTEEEFESLKGLCRQLYDLGDSPAFWGMGNQIDVPGKAPFQVFDLNGMMGVHLETEAYLDSHLQMILAKCQGQEPPKPETGILNCTLLPDYYVRTDKGSLEDVPQIKAEMARIQSDHDFLCSEITWEQIAERLKKYKELDILQ